MWEDDRVAVRGRLLRAPASGARNEVGWVSERQRERKWEMTVFFTSVARVRSLWRLVNDCCSRLSGNRVSWRSRRAPVQADERRLENGLASRPLLGRLVVPPVVLHHVGKFDDVLAFFVLLWWLECVFVLPSESCLARWAEDISYSV